MQNQSNSNAPLIYLCIVMTLVLTSFVIIILSLLKIDNKISKWSALTYNLAVYKKAEVELERLTIREKLGRGELALKLMENYELFGSTNTFEIGGSENDENESGSKVKTP